MNWPHIARHVATAIGITFVAVASLTIVTTPMNLRLNNWEMVKCQRSGDWKYTTRQRAADRYFHFLNLTTSHRSD
jgi:hypothetical protein